MLETFDFYKDNDCGKWGKSFESAIKLYFHQTPKVAKQGDIDFRRNRKCFEVKTGAGELDYLLKSKIKYVIYIPVVDETKEVSRQEGYILERTVFLQGLADCGMIRSKISTAGIEKTTIQTFYNHSRKCAHGKKLYAIMDKFDDTCIMTIQEYFGINGKM